MKACFSGLVGLAVSASLWLACEDPISHVFIAGQYNPKLDCVTPGLAIDVLNGPPLTVDASCDVVCVVPPFDSGVYATAQCAPFPPGDDLSGKNAQCPAAVAAQRRHDLCLDGGPSGPSGDAGTPDGKAEGAVLDAHHADGAVDATPRDGQHLDAGSATQ